MPTKSLDPSAALVSSLVMLAGFLGLMERWNWTADEVASALGAAMTVAAILRRPLERAWAWLERRVPWLREPVNIYSSDNGAVSPEFVAHLQAQLAERSKAETPPEAP